MLNASSTPSLVNHSTDLEQADNTARTEVTLTSLLTETVHPTLLITTGVTIQATPVAEASGTSSSQTDQDTQSEIPQSQTSSIETTAVETTTTQTTPAQTSSSQVVQSTSESPTFTIQFSTTTMETSSTVITMSTSSSQHVQETSVPQGSASPPSSIVESLLIPGSSTLESSTLSQSLVPTVSTASILPSLTPIAASSSRVSVTSSTFTPVASVAAGSSSTTNTASSQGNGSHHNTGAIVGGTLGGAAGLVLSIVACILFARRKRRTPSHNRQNSRQSLLRDRDSISSFNSPYPREPSQSFFPPTRKVSIPSAPALHTQQQSYLNPATDRQNSAHAASNQDLSLDRVYLRHEIKPDPLADDYADLERSPVSPIIEISPPSRSVSNYSRPSWEGGSHLPNYYDMAFPQAGQGNAHFSGESTLTLPDTGSQTSNFLETPKTRDSTRSDPFDLEPSEIEMQKDAPLPPPPAAHWKFPF